MPPRQFPTSLDPSSASSARPGPSSSALTYPAVSDPAAPSVPIRSPPFRPLPYSRCSLPAPAPAQLPSAKTCCLPPAGSSSCSPHLSNLNERTCARAPANFAAGSTSLSAKLPSRSEDELQMRSFSDGGRRLNFCATTLTQLRAALSPLLGMLPSIPPHGLRVSTC